jgi:hypothetical protein
MGMSLSALILCVLPVKFRGKQPQFSPDRAGIKEFDSERPAA